MLKSLPIGIENFQELRAAQFYYVDKTGFLKTLLENWGKGKIVYAPEAVRENIKYEYDEVLIRDGMETIYRYGIACYKKRCRVVSGERQDSNNGKALLKHK